MTDRRLALVSGLLFAVVLALNASFKVTRDEKEVRETSKFFLDRAQWQGKVAPPFDLTLTNGEKVSLADLVGKKVVVVNFFATWCGPCKAEMPELARFFEKTRGEPVVLVGVDAAETPATVTAFLLDQKVPYPVGIDADRSIEKAYGVGSYPTTVVIGPDGRVALYEAGAILNAEVSLGETMRGALAALAKGPRVTKEAYLDAAAKETTPARGRAGAAAPASALSGRPKAIADRMPCPCGCKDTVAACSCQTAEKIRGRLKDEAFGGKSDEEVMKEMGALFCSGTKAAS